MVRQRTLTPSFQGSNPCTPVINWREHQLSARAEAGAFFSAEFFCFQKKTCYIDLCSVCLLCLEFSDIYAKHSHIPRKEAVPIVNFSQKYSALSKQHGIRNDFIWNWEKRECNIWQIEQFFSDLLQHIQKIRLFLAVETIVQRGCFKV